MNPINAKLLFRTFHKRSNAFRNPNIFAALCLSLLLSAQSANADLYVTWPNKVPIIPDETNTVTLPKADVTLGFYGTYDEDPSGIQPGDYISVISNVQSCSSTMDMRNGALIGLGMQLLDAQSQTTLLLSIAPADTYTLCICAVENTLDISDSIVCRDLAGSDSGLNVRIFFLCLCLSLHSASAASLSQFPPSPPPPP